MLRLCKNTHDTFQYIYYSLRSIFIKDKVEPVMTSPHEITNGLTCFNMLDVLKLNIRLFEKAFCPSTILDWTQEEFVEYVMPEFSEEESNKKRTEVNTYKSFIDFVEAVFQDGNNFILWLFFCVIPSSICLKRVYV